MASWLPASIPLLVLVAAPCLAADAGWQGDEKLLAEMEKKKVSYIVRESAVPKYVLPDPLRMADGTRITTREVWESAGRPATLELFRRHVYGRTPPRPAEVRFETLAVDERAMEGAATLKRIRITSTDGGRSFAFEAAVLIPNKPAGKVPAFILINNRAVSSADPSRQAKDGFWPAEEIIARGYATAVFRTNDVDPDKNGAEARAKGVRGVWPGEGGDAWATIGVWAWGASRVLDYLETDGRIDATKVAVIGHSRGGKTALWAGAQDTRFAIAISNDSGCGGAALSRRRFGETVAAINKSFPYWFCENFKQFNGKEDDLPIDQHQLVALMAPRAVCVGSADADFWADQRGEFLSLAHAGPVYALYGLPTLGPDQMPPLEKPLSAGKLHYHIRRGTHNLTPYDWKCYMDFADGLWGN